jgi:hypothetical protein
MSFSLLPGKPQIDQEAYDAPVMADEVAHQDVNYVVVERNHRTQSCYTD